MDREEGLNEENKKVQRKASFVPPFHPMRPPFPPPPFPPHMMPPPMLADEDDFDEEIEIDENNIEEFLAQGYEIEVVDEADENDEPLEIDKSQVAEYLAQGYIIEEMSDGEDDAEEDVVQQPKGRSLVGDKNFKRMHAKIIEQAQIKKGEMLLKERKYAFVKLMTLIFLVALTLVSAGAGISLAIDHFSQEDEIPEELLAALESKEADNLWTLSSSTANDAVKAFFLTIGSLESVSKSSDEIVRGLVRYKGKEYIYKALKSRHGKNYISLTDAAGVETGYFFPSPVMGRRLLESTISGPSEIMDVIDEELLRSVMVYDEVLLAKAFPLEKDAVIAHRMLFENRGVKALDDVEYYSISVFLEGKEYNFYFDKDTSRLAAITYERESYKIKIKFSDYRRFSNALEFPALRQVWINDELLLTATSSHISRLNEVLLFPH